MNQSLKKRMYQGERLNGCFINLFSPIVTEIIASAGYDSILIDMEHGAGNYLDSVSMMQAANGTHCASLVRTESSDTNVIKRTMDIGPAGFMIPNVKSAQEARQIVRDSSYPPIGERGAATPVIRGSNYGMAMEDYYRYLTEDFLRIVQIESVEAVAQIDEIANVDGIDMIFIGPMDLSGSLGNFAQFDTDKFAETMQVIEHATHQAGKLLGTIEFPGWSTEALFEKNYHLALCGFDLAMIREAALENVAMARKAAGRD